MFFVEEFAGVFEEYETVGAFPFGIGVGEMRAYVAEGSGAEKRVTHGVSEYVAIGVSNWTLVEWQSDAADDERAAFGEAMQIVADSATDSQPFLGACECSLLPKFQFSAKRKEEHQKD
jgi:hypothetical protein